MMAPRIYLELGCNFKRNTVGETVTDGFKTYVLTSEFDYKFVSYGNHAQHHVSPEVLKMLVGEED